MTDAQERIARLERDLADMTARARRAEAIADDACAAAVQCHGVHGPDGWIDTSRAPEVQDDVRYLQSRGLIQDGYNLGMVRLVSRRDPPTGGGPSE